MDSESQAMKTDCDTWYCAYCLKLCGSPVNLCGGCKKRSYCTRECQIADWSSIRNGQGHVYWCQRHDCCGEEVVPIPNKGLGIRAKKLLPSGFKVIVEPVFYTPDGIKDLEPENATLEQKFISDIFLGSHYQVNEMQPVVALRIARVNHACQPNSATIYDETARVAILFAQKDIQPGEEITFCYYPAFFALIPIEHRIGVSVDQELHCFKTIMASEYGFTCTTDCSCNDPTIRALNLEGRKMFAKVEALTNLWKTEEALAAGEKLLDIYQRLNVCWIYRGHTYFNFFGVAVTRSETLQRAKEYMRSAVELFGKISPYSERVTKKYEKLLKNPETDGPNYLKMDGSSFIDHILSGLNYL